MTPEQLEKEQDQAARAAGGAAFMRVLVPVMLAWFGFALLVGASAGANGGKGFGGGLVAFLMVLVVTLLPFAGVVHVVGGWVSARAAAGVRAEYAPRIAAARVAERRAAEERVAREERAAAARARRDAELVAKARDTVRKTLLG